MTAEVPTVDALLKDHPSGSLYPWRVRAPRVQRLQSLVLCRLCPRRLKLPVLIRLERAPKLARNLRFWRLEA